ncbi:MAG: hypothetical protein IJX77_07035 [Ruminococcus sp.]|nr:hypothetical protein [Ruminococcus sp.]
MDLGFDKIYPFSPRKDINKNNKDEYEVYSKYLTAALTDDRIKNIAITGDFGVGKSSILRTFSNCNKLYHNHIKFFSLCDFENRDSQLLLNNNTQVSDSMDKSFCKNEMIRKFETILLNQIISQSKRNDIPKSRLSLIPEKNKYSLLITLLICLEVFLIASIIFSRNLAHLLKTFYFNSPISIKSIFIFLSIFIFIILVGISGYYIINHFKIQKFSLSVSHDNANISTEAEKNEYPLELNSLEIVYIFETFAEHGCKVVVFEDMDRLTNDIAMEILCQLRKLNENVNIRSAKHSNCIKFIYVLNDSIISELDVKKYTDYTLPVLPYLSMFMSNDKILRIFQTNFSDDTSTSTPSVQNQSLDLEPFKKFKKAYPKLNDYRILYQIKNEYEILKEIIEIHVNLENCHISETQILAFTTCKVLFPKEYYEIRNGSWDFFNINNNAISVFFKESKLSIPVVLQMMGQNQEDKKAYYTNVLLSNDTKSKKDILGHDIEEKLCIQIYNDTISKSDTLDKLRFFKDVSIEFASYMILAKESPANVKEFAKVIREFKNNQIFYDIEMSITKENPARLLDLGSNASDIKDLFKLFEEIIE